MHQMGFTFSSNDLLFSLFIQQKSKLYLILSGYRSVLACTSSDLEKKTAAWKTSLSCFT